MSRLFIFTTAQQNEFDAPPKLSHHDHAHYFFIDEAISAELTRLAGVENKVGFLVLLGYFLKCGKFFTTEQFRSVDIKYVTTLLGYDSVNMARYKPRTNLNHRNRIVKLLGWQRFNGKTQPALVHFIESQVAQSYLPDQILEAAIGYCCETKTEIPSYHIFNELITQSYRRVEANWLTLLKNNLTAQQKRALDTLLQPLDKHKNLSRTLITALKKQHQSLKPRDIAEGAALFSQIQSYFEVCASVIEKLNVSDKTTAYYADWVEKATAAQLKSFPNQYKRYLHLLLYIKHHYRLRHDITMDILKRSALNTEQASNQEIDKAQKISLPDNTTAVLTVVDEAKRAIELIHTIENTATCTALTHQKRVESIVTMIGNFHKLTPDNHTEHLENVTETAVRTSTREDYFDALEKRSLKLQNRCTPCLLRLRFDREHSDLNLLKAIDHFQTREGHILPTAPRHFLADDEVKAIGRGKQFRVSLYKALLFIHIAKATRAKRLNLLHSYRYRAFETYLIDKVRWETDKDILLEATGLSQFKDKTTILNTFATTVKKRIIEVNGRYSAGENPYLTLDNKGKPIIKTPKQENNDMKFISHIFENIEYQPISHILEAVNRVIHFTHAFKHSSIKNTKLKIVPAAIYAGLIAKGCNVGVNRMAKISAGINQDKLNHLVTWCFDLSNLQAANQRIINMIDQLALPNVYRANENQLHSSSDGRKVTVDVDSLMSTYSFKYFGKDKGVTVYTFIDERQLLFHSTVFSSSEREATYVIDGLTQNDSIHSDMHSTDTHGFTELIFAVSHLLNTTFAPRLKNVGKQALYGFSASKTYQNKGYAIVPKNRIRRKLIEAHWDDILRFMVTIKLRENSASILFKQLNSYTQDHPLYKALKEFGRIVKTHFLLNYFDNVKLRQRIELQLNRVELSNRFSKAIFYANNQVFQQGSPKDMLVATACKVLIQNAIVLWNYLYLSQYLLTKSGTEKKRILEGIRNGSMMCWLHVNLQGEFDFRKLAANQPMFDIGKILKLKIA